MKKKHRNNIFEMTKNLEEIKVDFKNRRNSEEKIQFFPETHILLNYLYFESFF